MNTFAIRPDHFDIIQSYIRQFIGDNQYVDSLHLNVKQDKTTILSIENDDLIAFLQQPQWPDTIDQTKTYTVELYHKYVYQFNYYDNNITVNIVIQKQPQSITPANIPEFNWNNISETSYIESSSPRFLNDVGFVIQLQTPNIEHFHLPDVSVANTIEFNVSSECDTYYKQYLALKKKSIINPKVFQINDTIMKSITANIKYYRANMKTDGIRTLAVIVNNAVQCYQHNDNIKFLYKHTTPINGTFIFDCELCLGRLHIFDCYVYTDTNGTRDVSLLNTDERIELVRQFTDTYTEYIGTKMISGEDVLQRSSYDFKNIAAQFIDFFERPDFNDIITAIGTLGGNINLLNSKDAYINKVNSLRNTFADNENIMNYIQSLLNSITTVNPDAYKSAYELCIKLKITSNYIFAYSPVLIEGLIGYYNQIGFLKSEEKIKKYAILFVTKCRDARADIPVSFTERITDMSNSYEYPNDGVIFVANQPIESAATKSIYFKWKPQDKLSADVKLVFDSSNVNIPFDGSTNRYVTANIVYTDTSNKDMNFKGLTTELLLNNFNKTLPKCENGDIVKNGSIVEVVPLFTGIDFTYKLLRIRYDKTKTNAKRTIDTIYSLQERFINILL